jgi:hypothetical protein
VLALYPRLEPTRASRHGASNDHGLDRHQRRGELAGVHIVITTYAVLARDIEEMAELAWHPYGRA